MSTHESDADTERIRQIQQSDHESQALEQSDAAKVAAVAAELDNIVANEAGEGVTHTEARIMHDIVTDIRTALADPDAALARVRAEARAEALRDAADEHERELVCCDVYDRLSAKGTMHWTADDRREYQTHSICYWGRACAVGDRERAKAVTS